MLMVEFWVTIVTRIKLTLQPQMNKLNESRSFVQALRKSEYLSIASLPYPSWAYFIIEGFCCNQHLSTSASLISIITFISVRHSMDAHPFTGLLGTRIISVLQHYSSSMQKLTRPTRYILFQNSLSLSLAR
jgi:hypothetical protein